ncbi:MAG: DNA polymerase [Phycisphaerales bacterium]
MFDPRTLGCLCDECPFRNSIAVPPYPTKPVKLIVLLESPGPTEEIFGKYLIGPSGDLFNDCLNYWGLDRDDMHITNSTMCRPKNKASPKQWREAIRCCSKRLRDELSKCRTTWILGCGAIALHTIVPRGDRLPSIKAWSGAPLQGLGRYKDFKILPTMHPAAVLREKGWAFKPIFMIHAKRAWDLAHNLISDWEWPPIHTAVNETTLRALREIRRAKKLTGADVETRGINPLRDLCMCIGVANEDVAVCVPWEGYNAGKYGAVSSIKSSPIGRRIMEEVVGILEDEQIPLAFQNGPHDLLTFDRLRIKWKNYAWDSHPAHTAVAVGRWHDLGWIMAEECHGPRWKEEKHTASNEKGAAKFAKRKPSELNEYCAKDSWSPVWLKTPLEQRLADESSGWEIYHLLMQNMRDAAMKMQTLGFRIDRDRMLMHRRLLRQRRSRAKGELRVIARKYWPAWGKEFNPNSQDHLRKLVFDKLKVRPRKWSAVTGKPSIDKEVLQDLALNDRPLVAAMGRAMLRFRQANKLVTTYCDPSNLLDSKTSCIHSSQRVMQARTFRWASSPNLANIPKPIERNGRVLTGLRDMFLPPTDDGWIVRADYDQQEIKIIALLAGAQRVLRWFDEKKDVHRMFGAPLFGRRPEDLSKNERDITKNLEYGWCYGAQPPTLHKTLVTKGFTDITLRQCIEFSDELGRQHPEIVQWHKQVLHTAYQERYIEAPLSGHRIYLYVRVKAQECFNLPVQHTAADLLNPAIKPIADGLNWRDEGILANIHDELVTGGRRPLKLIRLLIKHMERRITLNGKSALFSISGKIGRNFGMCVEIDRSKPLQTAVREAQKAWGKQFGGEWKEWNSRKTKKKAIGTSRK